MVVQPLVHHNGSGDQKEAKPAAEKPAGGSKALGTRKIAIVNTGMVQKLTRGKAIHIHRVKFTMVTLVGHIEELQVTTACMEFKLRDDEGTINVKRWKTFETAAGGDTASTDQDQKPQFLNDDLVRVFGQGFSKDKKEVHISAFQVLKVTSLNELTMHKLEVLSGILTLKKLKENFLAHIPIVEGFPKFSIERKVNPLKEEQLKMGLDSRTLVRNAIVENTTVKGISLDELTKALPSISYAEIRVVLERLLAEGDVYTTTDDKHFKCVDMPDIPVKVKVES